jgi:hypothetical protein
MWSVWSLQQMIPSVGYNRPLVSQQFLTAGLAVTSAAAIPVASNIPKERLITTLVISNPTGSGGSVFLGPSQGVASSGASQGLEIPAGTMPAFQIDQVRQLYELQYPLELIRSGLACNAPQMDGLPFTVWELSSMWLISSVAGPVNISAAFFYSMYF